MYTTDRTMCGMHSRIRSLPSDKEISIDTSDEQLMMQYAKGDADAFKQLYLRYEKLVYRFVYNGYQHEATARELFQDIWLRVVNASGSYEKHTPFKAWLFTIARNRLIDQYRSQARVPQDQATYHDDQSSTETEGVVDTATSIWHKENLTPEQIVSAVQCNDTLRDALQTLPMDQREAVMLKHIAGFNIKEIANLQATADQTVKSRLRYAMAKLRTQLQGAS